MWRCIGTTGCSVTAIARGIEGRMATLTLTSLLDDAARGSRLRMQLTEASAHGDVSLHESTALAGTLRRLSADLRRNDLCDFDATAEDFDPVARAATSARLLRDAVLHPVAGPLAYRYAEESDAGARMLHAEELLRDALPDIVLGTEELGEWLGVPAEQARLRVVRALVLAPEVLTWQGAEWLATWVGDWDQRLRRMAANGRYHHASAYAIRLCDRPHQLLHEESRSVVHMRVAADVVLRTNYRGPLRGRVELAARLLHAEVVQRFPYLRGHLSDGSRLDTGAKSLHNAFANHALELRVSGRAPAEPAWRHRPGGGAGSPPRR